MADLLRKDIDFSGLFRKLGHSLEEIRVRALENIQSKLEHNLICDADIVHEKQLYTRLLEWFNHPECSHKAEVLALIYRLAQHSAGSQILQDIGGVEFLSQLRSDIEPCHRPLIDQILESTMLLPSEDTQVHAPDCIYHKPTESAVWGNSMSSAAEGSRSCLSQTSESLRTRAVASAERLSQHIHGGPSYFAESAEQIPRAAPLPGRCDLPADLFIAAAEPTDGIDSLFHLSSFPWLPLTHTDQHVIASTNSTLQTRDPGNLIEACQFLADVVFQDFPAEIFLQRPEILKSLLCLVSLSKATDDPVVLQSCKSLTCYIQCLQNRIRFFQDPALYRSKQELSSSNPSLVSSLNSVSHLTASSVQQQNVADWGDTRHRGDGQDGDNSTTASRNSSIGLDPDFQNGDNDVDPDDGPRPLNQQLTLPQLCIAVLQRSLPRLKTVNEALGVGVLELVHQALTVLASVLDPGLWSDDREMAREIVFRLTDCLECMCELLEFHDLSKDSAPGTGPGTRDLTTHRVLYMALAATLARFILMLPGDSINRVVPEKLKPVLRSLVYDEPLAMLYPQCRFVMLAATKNLNLSVPLDFQQALDVCRCLARTCEFCLHWKDEVLTSEELAALAGDAVLSLNYHLYLPFVSQFVQFMSTVCSKKKTAKPAVTQCTEVLVKLMAYPTESVRQTCYSTMLDTVKKYLQVQQAAVGKCTDSLKCKFMLNADVLFELTCFGLADSDPKVRNCATESLHHLLKSQLLMSEGLWQEFILALLKLLPILQSYTDQSSPLGRCLWNMLDPTTTTHNLPLVEKMRGCLRLLYVSDKKLRTEAAQHVKWFLSNEQDSANKLPPVGELDVSLMSNSLIISNSVALSEGTGRSLFTVEGMRQVYDIFISCPVDPGVKKSAGDQLAAMMKDRHLHASFKEQGGLEVICSVIQQSVKKVENSEHNLVDVLPYLPACMSILRSLAQHDYSLRHSLARDSNLYYTLIRVSLLHQEETQIKTDVSSLLTFVLFDEVAKFDIRLGQSEAPGTSFSLPAQVIHRYRLPFQPSCHGASSPNVVPLSDPSSDIMTTGGPREMMKVVWNIAWHGDLQQLLSSSKTGLFKDVTRDFNVALTLSPMEAAILEASSATWNLQANMDSILNASSHGAVIAAVDRLLLYIGALKMPAVSEFFTNHHWHTMLEKFLTVKPTSSSDETLFMHILQFIGSVLNSIRRHARLPSVHSALIWLMDSLYRPEGPLISLMNKPAGWTGDGPGLGAPPSRVSRDLSMELLRCVMAVNLCLPYQLSRRSKPAQMRGDFVRKLLQGLSVTDTPHFYKLASLEGVLTCLMHVTARPGWSRESCQLAADGLCQKLLASLLEVIWSFYVGRGCTSQSFMGKGVTKSTALCLLHVSYEMIHNCEDQNWAQNWLYTRQDHRVDREQGLNWLFTLWVYRDPEVRAAGLGIAVSLTSTEAGRLLVADNCKHISGGIWGVSFSILLDSLECSLVRQQAALLLVNLTSQPMPSGDVDTRPGTWHGPLVTDTEYQVMLVGVKALVSLLEHTNFYGAVAELLDLLYTSSLIQPILVTTEVDNPVNSTLSSTDTSSLERTGQTLLTTLSSLSVHPASCASARTKTPPANKHNESAASRDTTLSHSAGSRDTTLSHSASSEAPHILPGSWRDVRFSQHPSANSSLDNQNLATPGLVSAVVKLLTNLVGLTPQTCLANMRNHSILSLLLSVINPASIQCLCEKITSGWMGSVSALTLRDLLLLYQSVIDLFTACVTVDTVARMELLANTAGLKSICTLLLLQWHDVDDINRACASLAVSTLQLLSGLLQTQGPLALKSLTPVLGQIWSPFMESMCSMLNDRSADQQTLYLVCLDFLSLLLCEESRSLVKNPDRVWEVATISELLDAPLGDDTQEQAKARQTTGRELCTVLLSVFDSVISPNKDEKTSRAGTGRLKVIGAVKMLLAVSYSAKTFALESGLAESLIGYIKQTHAQLNLDTLGMVKSGARKEDQPSLQELVVMFDLLRSYMYRDSDVKVACCHSGLTMVLHRLWTWCLQDPTLMSCVLSLVTTYTAHCNSAASSLTLTMSAQAVTKPGGLGSLLHYILKLTQKELDKSECSHTLRQLFAVLTNLAMNADCRSVLGKNPILNQFSSLNPLKRRGKVKVSVEVLWCELLVAFSFSVDGQQIILKIPDSLTVLMDMVEAGATRCQHCATLILRNLCCHTANKPKLLATERLLPTLLYQIRSKTDDNTQLVASSALWALIYNNHKARVQVKAANVTSVLADALYKLQTSNLRSPVNSSTCENLKAIIDAVQD
ncbi:hypothetical protein BsWGS_22732 [Bradybaena similaris]